MINNSLKISSLSLFFIPRFQLSMEMKILLLIGLATDFLVSRNERLYSSEIKNSEFGFEMILSV